MTRALRIGRCTLCGPYRTHNEDALTVERFAHVTVCAVADGMGGVGAGELASRLGAEVLARELKCRLPPAATGEQARQIIRAAVVRANEEVMTLDARQGGPGRRCGSTLVAAVWRNDGDMFVTHLGDSRAYRIRGGRLEQLTVDDTVANALISAGRITPEEARASRIRHVMYRFLGTNEIGEGPEVQTVPLQRGDRFLLCTDGLSNWLTDEQILRVVCEHEDVQQCAEALGRRALEQQSRDNVSCVVLELAGEPSPGEADDRPGVVRVEPPWLKWNDGCVPRIARSIREDRRFEALPILADALEDAGCTDADVLAHCREPGGHLTECWVLQALLEAAPFTENSPN
jgi:protein phosphatase